MRGYAIGDTHLRAADRRDALRRRALDQILADARREQPDFILWPGDLFDKTSTVADRQHLRHYIQAFADICPVFATRGNHDVLGDADLFGHLRATFPIHFTTTPQVVRDRSSAHAIAVACLPWPEEAALVALGIAPPDVPDVASAALDVICMQLADDLRRAADDGYATVVIGHANVVGAVASTGQPLIGKDISLRPEHLARFEGTPVLLNHIHASQYLHGATYIGSIAPQDWGECERKHYLTLEIDEGGWHLRSVPLQLPRLWHVEGTFDGRAVTWVVTKGPDGPVEATPASFAGDEVRVRFRFAAGDAGRLDLARAQLSADFAEVAHLELEPVAVPDRAVRAPEVAAAKTTADKLRAYCALSGVAVSDGVIAKLAALEGQEAAAVLAALEQRLQSLTQAESAVAA